MAADPGGKPKGFGRAPPAPPPPPTTARRQLDNAQGDGEARGRAALEQMRIASGSLVPAKRQQDELSAEELEPVDQTSGVMPEVVSQRMLKRVVPFAGLPIVVGALVFIGFWYANTQLELDLPPMVVAYTTFPLLLLSFGGISWGVMSTSWDEEDEGTLLGSEQVGKNVDLMRTDYRQARGAVAAEAELEDAEEAGVVMSQNQLKNKK